MMMVPMVKAITMNMATRTRITMVVSNWLGTHPLQKVKLLVCRRNDDDTASLALSRYLSQGASRMRRGVGAVARGPIPNNEQFPRASPGIYLAWPIRLAPGGVNRHGA